MLLSALIARFAPRIDLGERLRYAREERLINLRRQGSNQSEGTRKDSSRKYEARSSRWIQGKRAKERRGPARRARGRARKVPRARVRAQGDERGMNVGLFPVPRQFYEYEIRGRSVGRTAAAAAAAAHAARFAQSSQARPPYRLCIRPPASYPYLNLVMMQVVLSWTCTTRARARTHTAVLARATRKGRLTRGKSQTAPLPPPS